MLRRPHVVDHDGDGVVEPHDLPHARDLLDAGDLAAQDGTPLGYLSIIRAWSSATTLKLMIQRTEKLANSVASTIARRRSIVISSCP